jgi:hypothetical protein
MNTKMNISKSLLSLIILLITSLSLYSQNVGISPTGATPPDVNAGLDVNFTTKGLLVPRVALTSSASFAPLAAHVAGMVVYNTATVADISPGLYYDNGTKWITCLPKANTLGDMQYWDGTTWVTIPAGLPGQKLQLNSSGIPAWVP